MALLTSLEKEAKEIMGTSWRRSRGLVVPETDDVTLKDGAKDIDAAFLYADMAGSSQLAQAHYDGHVAAIIKSYVTVASRLITHNDGHIRSFDGDRVMGVYMGADKEARAVTTAFQLNYMVTLVLKALVDSKLNKSWSLDHGVGIANGGAMMVRGGVRGHNDLLAIGEAPNVAAKLSEVRGGAESVHITQAVWDPLPMRLCFTGESPVKSLWSGAGHLTVATGYPVDYRSSWRWLAP